MSLPCQRKVRAIDGANNRWLWMLWETFAKACNAIHCAIDPSRKLNAKKALVLIQYRSMLRAIELCQVYNKKPGHPLQKSFYCFIAFEKGLPTSEHLAKKHLMNTRGLDRCTFQMCFVGLPRFTCPFRG